VLCTRTGVVAFTADNGYHSYVQVGDVNPPEDWRHWYYHTTPLKDGQGHDVWQVGDPIQVADQVGTVAATGVPGGLDHLHFSVEEPVQYANGCYHYDNPLLTIAPSPTLQQPVVSNVWVTKNGARPLHPTKWNCYWFRHGNDGADWWQPDMCVLGLQQLTDCGGEIDIVVEAHASMGPHAYLGIWRLSYSISYIEGEAFGQGANPVLVESRVFVEFSDDVPIPGVGAAIYWPGSSTQGEQRYVITNWDTARYVDEWRNIGDEGAWHVPRHGDGRYRSGLYQVVVEARNLDGGTVSDSFYIMVDPREGDPEEVTAQG